MLVRTDPNGYFYNLENCETLENNFQAEKSKKRFGPSAKIIFAVCWFSVREVKK